MTADHARAGTGGGHDIFGILEEFDGLPGQGYAGLIFAAVIAWLPAAGLLHRDMDLAAGLFKKSDGRESHRGAQQVGKAGDEQVWHENSSFPTSIARQSIRKNPGNWQRHPAAAFEKREMR